MFDKLLAKVFTFFAQVMVKIQPIWDRAKVPIALIVGILIGWFVLGWGLFPIEWTNATPAHLREDWRSAYVASAADEFYRTGDMALLQSRLGLDLPKTKNVPWLAQEGLLQQDLQVAVDKAARYRLDGSLPALMGLQQIAAQDPAALFPGEATGEQADAAATRWPGCCASLVSWPWPSSFGCCRYRVVPGCLAEPWSRGHETRA